MMSKPFLPASSVRPEPAAPGHRGEGGVRPAAAGPSGVGDGDALRSDLLAALHRAGYGALTRAHLWIADQTGDPLELALGAYTGEPAEPDAPCRQVQLAGPAVGAGEHVDALLDAAPAYVVIDETRLPLLAGSALGLLPGRPRLLIYRDPPPRLAAKHEVAPLHGYLVGDPLSLATIAYNPAVQRARALNADIRGTRS